MGHARAVLTAPDPEALIRDVIAKGLSVRQTEERARSVKPTPGADVARSGVSKPVDADVVALERQLGDTLGLKVAIANNGSKGTVTLHYSSLDQLDLVCQRLSGEPI